MIAGYCWPVCRSGVANKVNNHRHFIICCLYGIDKVVVEVNMVAVHGLLCGVVVGIESFAGVGIVQTVEQVVNADTVKLPVFFSVGEDEKMIFAKAGHSFAEIIVCCLGGVNQEGVRSAR